MLSTELHEATITFARALRRAPALAAYRTACDALDADPAAQALIAAVRDRQARFVALQRADGAIDPAGLEGLRAAQAAVRANEVVMAHLRATSEVKAFLPDVGRQITATLGIDYGRLVAPQSC